MSKSKKSRHSSSTKHSNRKHSSSKPNGRAAANAIEDKALTAMCPRCGAFPGKSCKHTKGAAKGQRCEPHGDRIKLSKVTLSVQAQNKIREVEQLVDDKPKKKNPKEKLTPEQKEIVETI